MTSAQSRTVPAAAEYAIFGGGPAGLMAADYLVSKGQNVTLYERMPTVGRKFLMAGKSGLNLTHNEDYSLFLSRYGESLDVLKSIVDDFNPSGVRQWADALGAETYVGTSGKIFPKVMKASPLLRSWISRLQAQGLVIKTRHEWLGFDHAGHRLNSSDGQYTIKPDVAIFALGGASWPKLGSDGIWQKEFTGRQIEVEALKPANCGFDVLWSETMKTRFAGVPVKTVLASTGGAALQGEFVITPNGVEGSLIYAFSAFLREQLLADKQAILMLDLAPAMTVQKISQALQRQDRKASLATKLRKAIGLSPVKIALLRESPMPMDFEELAQHIKKFPLHVLRTRPLAEAISSAGGVRFKDLNADLMLKKMPGIFVAGEMLDWEAPTGGYLLTACFATGLHAARGAFDWACSRNP